MENERGKRELLRFSHVSCRFQIDREHSLRAAEDVSLAVEEGECLAVVGESGCGKSTLARLAARLLLPASGEIFFDGRNVSGLRGEELRLYRRQVQMIFQDSAGVVSPRMRIGAFLMEPWRQYEKKSRAQARELACYSLKRVGLGEEYFHKYPHQLSGGELQRVCLARAISLHPRLLICDEATSALDVSVQKQIIRLLREHQEETRCGLLFICHDLALAESFGNRIAVMYLGRVVELLAADHIRDRAAHPYTRALLDSVFSLSDDPDSPIPVLAGEPPSPMEAPSGCAFCSRCPQAWERCRREAPLLRALDETGHLAACHRLGSF